MLRRAGPMLLLFLLALVVAVPSAKATILLPGTTVVPAADGGGFVSLLADVKTPFSFAGTTGSVEEVVLSGVSSNPFGGLSFVYQVNVTGGHVEHITGFDFTGSKTDVQYVFSCGGCGSMVTGTAIADTANRFVDGSTVSFNWLAGVTAGVHSALEIINTDASSFSKGSIGVIDGGGATVDGFAPAVEPASSVLLGVSLLMGGVFRKKLFA